MASAVQTPVLRAGTKEFSVRALLSRATQKMAGWSVLSWYFKGRAPTQLLYTPFDMHLADPNLAHEIYHGRFPLAGRVVQIGASSPFLIAPPTKDWQDALHSFSWLNHMMAADTELADAHARSLTRDWMTELGQKTIGPAWGPGIAARRLSAWLAHADMLYTYANQKLKKEFLKHIGQHIRFLRLAYAGEKNSDNRLMIAISLAMAALVVSAPNRKRAERLQAQASRRLNAELDWQILPDGGHISRNPAMILEVLSNLIPLQYAYLQCNIEPPRALIVSIDRMLPALRFFRHRDGGLANFNGVGPIDPQAIDMVLDIDDAEADPASAHAPHSGYQRLCGGQTVVLADTGHSFNKKLTEIANAGCLSFEMSAGIQRFVVNCGIDTYGSNEIRFFGRLTAAHSTAVVDDTSSVDFANKEDADSSFIGPMLNVAIDRLEENNGLGFIATHDGYKNAFNLIHERSLLLSDDGMTLRGYDNFFPAVEKPGLFSKQASSQAADQIAIRFHIHPDIKLTLKKDTDTHQTGVGAQVILQGDGQNWLFTANCAISLEDSIYFSGLEGPLKTQQIVLNFTLEECDKITWCFKQAIVKAEL